MPSQACRNVAIAAALGYGKRLSRKGYGLCITSPGTAWHAILPVTPLLQADFAPILLFPTFLLQHFPRIFRALSNILQPRVAGKDPIATQYGTYCNPINRAKPVASTKPIPTQYGGYCNPINRAKPVAGTKPIATQYGTYCNTINRAKPAAGLRPPGRWGQSSGQPHTNLHWSQTKNRGDHLIVTCVSPKAHGNK